GQRRRVLRGRSAGVRRRDADARRPGAIRRRGGAGMTRFTVAQALVRFLGAQMVERDGVRAPFFAGCFGIFGRGNVGGSGQALALPEDVQAEAFDWPEAFLEPRVWTVYRQPPAPEALGRAAELLHAAQRPLIVAGGGVIYSEATGVLRALVDATGIPVCETQAGRGALVSDHPLSLGAVGATGTAAANRLAHEADLVVGVGTRWSDFTTSSKAAFQNPDVRFVNVNVASFDAAKHTGLPVLADARVALEAL